VKRKIKKSPKRRNIVELIQTASSKRLETLAKKLKPGHKHRAKIQDELVARDLHLGGPHKSWGHG
jgi:hypothetical protein